MAYKLTYLPEALTTLEEIFDWSREHQPETTEQFGDGLFDHLNRLTLFPYVGQILKSAWKFGGFLILRCSSTTG